jgi:hypothetical protein
VRAPALLLQAGWPHRSSGRADCGRDDQVCSLAGRVPDHNLYSICEKNTATSFDYMPARCLVDRERLDLTAQHIEALRINVAGEGNKLPCCHAGTEPDCISIVRSLRATISKRAPTISINSGGSGCRLCSYAYPNKAQSIFSRISTFTWRATFRVVLWPLEPQNALATAMIQERMSTKSASFSKSLFCSCGVQKRKFYVRGTGRFCHGVPPLEFFEGVRDMVQRKARDDF